MKHNTKKLVLSGLFLAIGLVLPFLTGQIPEIGNMISPMHFPVLLCGFICGAPYGALVGLILPPVRFLLFQMPPLYPVGLAMAFEMQPTVWSAAWSTPASSTTSKASTSAWSLPW